MARAAWTISDLGGTVFRRPTALWSDTEEMVLPFRHTILPNWRWATSPAAATPKRVLRMRSRGLGDPPRWMWPRTVTRTSRPVYQLAHHVADAVILQQVLGGEALVTCPQ